MGLLITAAEVVPVANFSIFFSKSSWRCDMSFSCSNMNENFSSMAVLKSYVSSSLSLELLEGVTKPDPDRSSEKEESLVFFFLRFRRSRR